MLKKLTLIGIVSCVLNLQGASMSSEKENVFKYIPAKSEVRTYCEKNENNENSQIIKKYLEKMSNSRSNKWKMDIIDQKIQKLDEKASLVQSENIPNFDNYVTQEKASLVADKVILKNQHITSKFPEEGEDEDKAQYNSAVKNILSTIDVKKYDREQQYLREGFSNAYEHANPWNTHTTATQIAMVLWGTSASALFLAIFMGPGPSDRMLL